MPEPTDGERRCVRCDAVVPADRSVCPSCGTLQPPGGVVVPTRPKTIGPVPVEPPAEPGRGELPGLPGGPSGRPPARAVPTNRAAALGPEPAARPEAFDDDLWTDPAAEPAVAVPPAGAPRRRRLPVALGLLAVVAVAAAAAFVVLRDDEGGDRADRGPAPSATVDRAGAIAAFCSDPRALGTTIAPFAADEDALAYVEHPPPPGATQPGDDLVLQVAPTLGPPTLTLEGSAALVNVAVCLEERSTKAAKGTCRYELTTPGDLGEEVERPLRQTTYRATMYELATGDELASGTISTPTDACPEFAFTDLDGVVAPLADDQLVAWVADHVPPA